MSLLLVGLSTLSAAQRSSLDSAVHIPYLSATGGYYLPASDLASRVGTFAAVGAQAGLKFASNIYLSMRVDYLFGNQVMEDDILDNLKTSEGGIIEVGGELTSPLLEMRGMLIALSAGYVFKLPGKNHNSGFLLSGGPVYLRHKIGIDYRDAQIPQLEEGYVKGYDRLTAGFGIQEFAGYIFFGRRRFVNFYAGLEFIQSRTKSLRKYNYDEQQADTEIRNDYAAGLRAGWMITLRRRQPEKFYYD